MLDREAAVSITSADSAAGPVTQNASTHITSLPDVFAGFDISLARVFGSLAVCLIIAVAAILLIRRFSIRSVISSGTSSKLRLADTLRIDSRTTVYRIESGNSQFLLVRSGTSISITNDAQAHAERGQ